MRKIHFHKYQGTGNDFVMIDNRNLVFDKKDKALIGLLCDRRFGIGADGVILIENHHEADFEMIYFNPDASQSLCGNGSRCAVKFAHALGIIGEKTTFMSFDGIHQAQINGDLVELHMQDVEKVSMIGDDYLMDTGSPHYIQFTDSLEKLDVYAKGQDIRNNKRFEKEGVNVNFIEKRGPQEIAIRTYERGVEQETLSCGTGCTAAALAMGHEGERSPVTIHAKGGDLQVSFEKVGEGFKHIQLTGAATKVFEGEFDY